MIKINGLHLLLTYQCTSECNHCFVWGSPWQTGTMTSSTVRLILNQAKEAGSVDWIYFEGGEPFLYYQTMIAGIDQAIDLGFKVGVVTNSYWATSEEDARLWLSPMVGKIQDLTISSDMFHFSEKVSQQSLIVTKIARELNIPLGVICIEQPEILTSSSIGQIPAQSSSVMFRGRAAEKLAPTVTLYPANKFFICPHENLTDPGRVHIDPFGNLHICQGISIGNVYTSNLTSICEEYDHLTNPIVRAINDGGPFKLAVENGAPITGNFADACHLCYETRKYLRNKFPETLLPDQMYSVA
jgi:MoaA/NifB/PqqE/SkfB family radical SAM enzyme